MIELLCDTLICQESTHIGVSNSVNPRLISRSAQTVLAIQSQCRAFLECIPTHVPHCVSNPQVPHSVLAAHDIKQELKGHDSSSHGDGFRNHRAAREAHIYSDFLVQLWRNLQIQRAWVGAQMHLRTRERNVFTSCWVENPRQKTTHRVNTLPFGLEDSGMDERGKL